MNNHSRYQRPSKKLNEKSKLFNPTWIVWTTIVIILITVIDSTIQHNTIYVTFLVALAFATLGAFAYKTTQKPGEFTRRVAKVGFWRALFSAKSNVDNTNSRRRRNLR